MKIYIPNESSQKQGGGWSWISSFTKGMGDAITDSYQEASHIVIASASMVKPEVAEQAHSQGRKIILRCDNALRHSRNNGKGMERMRRIAAVSDLVVYQCQWSKDYLDDFLGNPNSTIIYNGIDLDIFKPEGEKLNFGYSKTYLYASAAKGENKRWDAAWYDFQFRFKKDPSIGLLIAGRVPTEVMNHGFDFFNGEKYQYLGMMTTPEQMAATYRSADYFYGVFENDCYSNGILEAAMCGLELINCSTTGGTPELLVNLQRDREYNGIERMVNDYKTALINL